MIIRQKENIAEMWMKYLRNKIQKKKVKCFKYSVERRVNPDFLVCPEGFALLAGDLLIESASFKEEN